VVGICQRYGVSRQTFYNLQERFLSAGTAGLLAKKQGPKGPSKVDRGDLPATYVLINDSEFLVAVTASLWLGA